MTDLEKAKALLASEGYTCALCKGEDAYTSRERGVKPLLSLLDGNKPFCGYSAADKVVGKGAAFLYVLLGVSRVHACVISAPAKETLLAHGIGVTFDTEVAAIRNRTDTGPCPIESAVIFTDDPDEALILIREKLKILSTNR